MVVMTRPVLPYSYFGVRASSPVQLEMNCGRIVHRVRDDFLQHRAEDTPPLRWPASRDDPRAAQDHLPAQGAAHAVVK